MVKAERGRTWLRKLDRWIGVPALMFLSIFRQKRQKPEQFQRVGICVFAAIGDALLASSLIADLKKTFPNSKITVFATPANAIAFGLIEGFEQLVLVPITNPLAAIQTIRAHPVDILIDTSQWSRIGALVSALSGAPWTVGFETAGQNRHYVYDFSVKHSPNLHELSNFGALLAPLGIQGRSLPPIDLTRLASADCLKMRQPFVVLHPWASGHQFELREWPLSSWVALGQKLLQAGYGLVITGGPGDVARAKVLCEQIDKDGASGKILNLAGASTLIETANYLKSAAAVVCVNTGTMHLAALLGVPLVALHGPTNPIRWGPIYPNEAESQSVILGPGPHEGGAYLNLGFEYPSNPSYLMDQISVNDVLDALRKFSINTN